MPRRRFRSLPGTSTTGPRARSPRGLPVRFRRRGEGHAGACGAPPGRAGRRNLRRSLSGSSRARILAPGYSRPGAAGFGSSAARSHGRHALLADAAQPPRSAGGMINDSRGEPRWVGRAITRASIWSPGESVMSRVSASKTARETPASSVEPPSCPDRTVRYLRLKGQLPPIL